ncbi:reticulon-4-interacting protein 1-like protein [Leptotrombidium deliense]|uniref:Reticulon-4-interacting protein 1-like protein n=1 Tax=Leptotrombidium deliense TaxID=299467 RepID=A0A443SMM3_9ACAR|nr:reticulon-4-interacting protein 1-like protein [Leptotrombidium deliense]
MRKVLKRNVLSSVRQSVLEVFSRGLQTMKAWQINQFGEQLSSVLFLNDAAKRPSIRKPDDVLVRVSASSVNLLDVYMCKGYGHSLMQCLSLLSELRFPNETLDRFPLTFGRDFSGVVIDKGESVTKYKVGDCVWGVSSVHEPGTHSEYICVPQLNISEKPANISHVDAASLPFAALTAWSAICTFGGLNRHNTFGKRVLVLGGTGGVGTVAIQLLKSWGAFVVTTCSSDAIEWITHVAKVDECVDYKSNSLSIFERSFDLVLDFAKRDQTNSLDTTVLRTLKKNCLYVTLNTPLVRCFDEGGLILGSASAAAKAVDSTAKGMREGVGVRWAHFYPNAAALQSLKEKIEKGELHAVVDKVYKFEQLEHAYTKVYSGHARGKTVIQVSE